MLKFHTVHRKKMWYFILPILGILLVVFFVLGLHRRADYIQNFEEAEYGIESPFVKPDSMVDGLAVYHRGQGPPVLLFPYPHGHTTEPMVQGPIADILNGLGRQVITFDVPGAFRSTREPTGKIVEIIQAADETLDRLGIQEPVDVVGHSMSGFTALAYAIERPERTNRLILIASVSGFPAAARCGFPGSAFSPFEGDYWRVIIWGMRINGGRANLDLHKKLHNLMSGASYYNQELFTPLPTDDDDHDKGVPIRMIWSKNMYTGLSYADRLAEVRAQTLILAGRHDPQASLPCSEELATGIPNASIVIFEESGHYPYAEEPALFTESVAAFLAGEAWE